MHNYPESLMFSFSPLQTSIPKLEEDELMHIQLISSASAVIKSSWSSEMEVNSGIQKKKK